MDLRASRGSRIARFSLPRARFISSAVERQPALAPQRPARCRALLRSSSRWDSHIAGVIAALGISAVVTAIVGHRCRKKAARHRPDEPVRRSESTPSFARIWKLSSVTYLRDLSLYFATPAFASPVLVSMLGGPEPVASSQPAYFVASSTVTLVVSGFRGVYRPAFARVLAAGDHAQLQRAFDLMNKVQVLIVVPAGFGLWVMVADYLPCSMASRSRRRCPSRACWSLCCSPRPHSRLPCSCSGWTSDIVPCSSRSLR